MRTWTNITSVGDIVADGFPLAPVFGAVVEARVDNGHRAHEPEPYLCAQVTGAAIAAGLAGEVARRSVDSAPLGGAGRGWRRRPSAECLT